MGNSRLIKLALVFGRCKMVAAEDTGGYMYGDYYEPYVSRFAYHALVEFRHKHYPVPKMMEFRWNRSNRTWLARLLNRIDKSVACLYRWRLKRAKCIGVRGSTWWYHCPKCGAKLFYSPRTHPCPSCVESVAVVGNSEITPTTETSASTMSCYNCGTTENVGDAGLCGDCMEDEDALWDDTPESDEGPEDDW